MKEQFVESAAAWFLLGLALGICIAVFVNMVFSFKNIEINDLKKQISIETAKAEAYKFKDFEMRNLEGENENLKKELVQKEKDLQDLKLKEKSHKEAFERLSKF